MSSEVEDCKGADIAKSINMDSKLLESQQQDDFCPNKILPTSRKKSIMAGADSGRVFQRMKGVKMTDMISLKKI
jgi:hypothetical protein